MLYVGYACIGIVALQVATGLFLSIAAMLKPAPVSEQDTKAASWEKFGGFGERS